MLSLQASPGRPQVRSVPLARRAGGGPSHRVSGPEPPAQRVPVVRATASDRACRRRNPCMPIRVPAVPGVVRGGIAQAGEHALSYCSSREVINRPGCRAAPDRGADRVDQGVTDRVNDGLVPAGLGPEAQRAVGTRHLARPVRASTDVLEHSQLPLHRTGIPQPRRDHAAERAPKTWIDYTEMTRPHRHVEQGARSLL